MCRGVYAVRVCAEGVYTPGPDAHPRDQRQSVAATEAGGTRPTGMHTYSLI